MTLPAPFINIPTVHNLRDVGGYPLSNPGNHTRPDQFVRKGVVYRSADPSKLSATGITDLQNLGVTAVFDLRAKPEIEKHGGVDGFVTKLEEATSEGGRRIQRIWTPVFKEQDYSPESVSLRYREYARIETEGFVKAYSDILSHGAPSYRQIFQHLSRLSPDTTEAILVHCTGGKDRTGVMIALLLSLLGVAASTVADEYALTEIGLKELKPIMVQRLIQNDAFKDSGGREGVERMITSKKENMVATLEMIRRVYGGAEGYLKDKCGLGDGEIEAIRRALVVNSEEDRSGPVL